MKDASKIKILKRKKRHRHILKRLRGTADRPRVVVRRSLKHFYVQVVDDEKGVVITGASTLSPEIRSELSYGGNKEAAARVGELVAKRLNDKGIKRIAFDRAGYKYHGRVKECAEAIRKGGIEF